MDDAFPLDSRAMKKRDFKPEFISGRDSAGSGQFDFARAVA